MKKNFWAGLMAASLLVSAIAAGAMALIMSNTPKSAMIDMDGRGRATLILDPGHGGADGGAVSVTGTYESKLNLDIALKAQALAGFYGIVPVMTRTSEEIDYPGDAGTIHAKKVADTKAREALINDAGDAVLISIHQNKYTTSGPKGSQVFYAPTEGSTQVAETIQALLAQISEDNDRGIVKIGKNVYLMNHITCPGVLIECGFLSNPAEARSLESAEYQLKLAAVIVGGYIQSVS